jgi:hypothetical protein
MQFQRRCGIPIAALLMAILLVGTARVAGAEAVMMSSMMADGEPGKGFMPPPSRAPDVVSTPGPFSLSAPMRLDVTAFKVPSAVAAERSWCTYRITGFAGTKRRGPVTPGDEICVSNQDLFGASPDVAEFHFLDTRGRELVSAYGELVAQSCGSCAIQVEQRFSLFRR